MKFRATTFPVAKKMFAKMNTLVLPALAACLVLLAGTRLARAEPPVNQYLPPDQLYGPPGVQQRPPPPQIGGGAGQFGSAGSAINQYLPPNQQYGAPGIGGGNGVGGGYPGGNGGYAGGNGGYGGSGGYDDGSNGEPAKYEFEYQVNDPPSGNDFGHKESRDGDLTRGIYYVLLPDGRRQMVEYEADQDGYRPKISYEQVGAPGGGAGGYPGGAGGYPGAGGYQGAAGGYSGSAGGYPGAGSAGGYPSGGPSGSGNGGYRY